VLAWLLAGAALAADRLEESPTAASRVTVEELDARCDRGDARACHRAGRRYHLGNHGAPADPVRAAASYAAACRGGIAADCGVAAWFHVTEVPDASKAAVLATTGCEAKDEVSCFALGHLQLLGAGVTRDPAAGLARLEAACTAKIPEACGDLGIALAGGVQGVPADPARATPLLKEACDGGTYPLACGALGILALRDEAPGVDAAAGRAYAKQGCELGDAAVCEAHAAALMRGLGGEVDVAGAIPSLERACDGGRALACSELAAMALNGVSMPLDRPKGLALAKRACTLGDEAACAELDQACEAGAKDACR
jgi:TPR repeat protein